MAWRAITEADLLTRISGAELEAFREAALADGQVDPVGSIFTQVSDTIRGYVAANEKNSLGMAGTIPVNLMGTAIDLSIIEIPNRVAGMLIDPEDIREKKMARAERRLRDVAADKFKVEQPDSENEAEEDFGGTTSPISTSPTRRFDHTSQDGI